MLYFSGAAVADAATATSAPKTAVRIMLLLLNELIETRRYLPPTR
jgi:hypothetical protein